MRTLEQQITQYAAYHRDRRNIFTHFFGVPMIVFAVVLALVPLVIGGVNAALIALAMAAVYYVFLDVALGTAMLIFLFVCYLISIYINARIGHAGAVVGIAAVVFIVGWVIQFVGHKYEGMKPAFLDDIMGLLIGPLFVMTEVFFLLGLKANLKKYVEDRVGPTLAERNGAPIGPQA
ncbi:MAG: Mpo1-like protein [Betaproteobacteria bacterium]